MLKIKRKYPEKRIKKYAKMSAVLNGPWVKFMAIFFLFFNIFKLLHVLIFKKENKLALGRTLAASQACSRAAAAPSHLPSADGLGRPPGALL